MKIFCAFGQHNYGDLARGESPEYACFISALVGLGHKVYHFETWNRKGYRNMSDLNIRLLTDVRKFSPDLFFSVHLNYEIWLETIDIIKLDYGIPSVSWATDDSWKYNSVSRFIAPSYDLIATTCAAAISFYRKDGLSNYFLSQWAAQSDSLKPPIPAKDCRYAISFVGSADAYRRRWVNYLHKCGICVSCFGHGWPNGPVSSFEMKSIFRESIISLNFANSYGKDQIKARTFEVPGSGGFLLSQMVDTLDQFYTPGIEIDVFKSRNDLTDKISYYLARPFERDAIAQAGYIQTFNKHTYERRFEPLVDYVISMAHSRVPQPCKYNIDAVVSLHYMTRPLAILTCSLSFIGCLLFGARRGPRAARRLIFELSWRLVGRKTFMASGWPGLMFPHD